MPPRAKITENPRTRRRWRKLKIELGKHRRGDPTVVVGVQGQKATAQHKGGEGATVAEIAAFHEFGRGFNPERSFIRATVDRNSGGSDGYAALFRKLLGGVTDGKLTTKRALSVAGLRIQSDMVQAINLSLGPVSIPLKAATKARKGSSKPLIDTGQLKGSITFKLEGI